MPEADDNCVAEISDAVRICAEIVIVGARGDLRD